MSDGDDDSVYRYLKEQGFQSAQELIEKDLPPRDWLIRGWVSRGDLVVLAGRPKEGKSLLACQMSIAVATGKPFLGQFETKANAGPVLYYDLDDKNERRAQDRILDLSGDDLPRRTLQCHYSLEPGNAGIQTISSHLMDCALLGLPVAMVVVDCLLALVGKTDDKNLVRSDRKGLEPLRAVAAGYRVPIVLIHHTRKSSQLVQGYSPVDSMLGTTGLSSVFDVGILVENTDKEEHRILFSSRDPQTPDNLVLKKDKQNRTGWYVVAGQDQSGPEKEPALSETAAIILQVLADPDTALTPKEICDRAQHELGLPLKPNTVQVNCGRLARRKFLINTGGKYRIAPECPLPVAAAPPGQNHCQPVSLAVNDGNKAFYSADIGADTILGDCQSVSQPSAETDTLTHTEIIVSPGVSEHNTSSTKDLSPSADTLTGVSEGATTEEDIDIFAEEEGDRG